MEKYERDVHNFFNISSVEKGWESESGKADLQKCRHRETGTEYYLKSFRKFWKSDNDGRKWIKATLELDHPNILHVCDIFYTQDLVQLIFENYEGSSLLQELNFQDQCRFDEKVSSNLVFQIYSAAKYLFRKRNFLFNFNLSNILISKLSAGYYVKITDFGCFVSSSEDVEGEGYDLFSIGLITFSLVTGILPIVLKGDEETFFNSLQNSEEFQRLSHDCKSFISICLQNHNLLHMNLDVIHTHPWLNPDHKETDISINPNIFQQLNVFSRRSLFARAMILAISFTLTDQRLERVRAEFSKLDSHGNGELTYADFFKYFKYYGGFPETEARRIFTSLNIKRSTAISYHVFLSAIITEEEVTEDILRITFHRLCRSNQATMLLSDIEGSLGSNYSRVEIVGNYAKERLKPDSHINYQKFKDFVGFHHHDTTTSAVVSSASPIYRTITATNTSTSSYNGSMVESNLKVIQSDITIYNNTLNHRQLQTISQNIILETSNTDIHQYYEVDENTILGSGASGHVVKCRHRLSGVLFALKTLHKKYLSPNNSSFLRREVLMMTQLDHPNIIRLFEWFETKDSIHMILELCTGQELLSQLNSQPYCRYSERAACQIIHDILGAVTYCHDRKIAHRDLKLENFLLESNSKHASIKLIDFGLSCYFSNTHYMTDCIGTPYYVAPEVLGRQYNEKCDIWSIGVITYMLLTGSPVFNGDSDEDIIRAVIRGEIMYDSHFDTVISPAGRSFVSCCLMKDARRRPSARAAQHHVWFQSLNITQIQSPSPPLATQLPTSIVSNLLSFADKTPLARFFLGILSHTLSSDNLFDIKKTFLLLNSSDSGELSYEELRCVLVTLPLFYEYDIRKLFNCMDEIEHVGKIRYHQFIAAAVSVTEIEISRWKLAFTIASHHSKYITVEDIRDFLGKDATTEGIEKLLVDCQGGTSCQLSFLDFQNIINGSYKYVDNHNHHHLASTNSNSNGSKKKIGTTVVSPNSPIMAYCPLSLLQIPGQDDSKEDEDSDDSLTSSPYLSTLAGALSISGSTNATATASTTVLPSIGVDSPKQRNMPKLPPQLLFVKDSSNSSSNRSSGEILVPPLPASPVAGRTSKTTSKITTATTSTTFKSSANNLLAAARADSLTPSSPKNHSSLEKLAHTNVQTMRNNAQNSPKSKTNTTTVTDSHASTNISGTTTITTTNNDSTFASTSSNKVFMLPPAITTVTNTTSITPVTNTTLTSCNAKSSSSPKRSVNSPKRTYLLPLKHNDIYVGQPSQIQFPDSVVPSPSIRNDFVQYKRKESPIVIKIR